MITLFTNQSNSVYHVLPAAERPGRALLHGRYDQHGGRHQDNVGADVHQVRSQNIVHYYNKNAHQCIIGEEIMPARPWGIPRPQAKGPQGLEGIISSPIMHWMAFFILFHHIYDQNVFILTINS